VAMPVFPVESRESPLVKKLADVMKTIKRLQKRGRNTFHGYDYVTEADVLDVLREELANRSVIVLPRIVSKSREIIERKSKDGVKTSVLVDVDMTFSFMDGDSGEIFECPWAGCGEDSGDKGLYKAITGSDKYFLMKVFMISTGDDPERDKPKRKADVRSMPASPESTEPTIDAEQLKTLYAAVAAAGLSNAEAKAIVSTMAGVHQARLIPKAKFDAILAALHK
jgi:hypothetical protein